jgi:hypothetical protein
MPLSQKQKVRIKENSWVARVAAAKLRSNKIAFTFGHTIYLFNTSKADFISDQNWVCHELMHVKQFEQYGLLPFLLKYLWESIRKGYYRNKYEAEARQAESNPDLLLHFDLI